MATRRWIGAKAPINKKDKLVVDAPSPSDVYSLTSNESTATYVAVTGDTVVEVVDGLIAAAGIAAREFRLMTFTKDTVDTDTFYAESATTGHDFDLSVNAQVTLTSESVATGPNWWHADNFEGGVAPVDTDTVVFEKNSVDLLFNLDQSALVTITLEFRASYTGRVGWPNVNGQGGFPEYRDQFLKIDSGVVVVGLGEGNGSSRIKLDLDAHAATAVTVFKTGTSSVSGQRALQIRNGTAIDLSIADGEVQLAPFAVDPANTTLNALDVAGGTVICGSGVTTVSVDQSGGVVETESDVLGGNIYDGILRIYGDAAAGANGLSLLGGTLESYSTGAIITLTIDNNSTADFSFVAEAGTTITTLNFPHGELRDPHQRVVVTTLQDYRTLRAS